MNFSAKLRLYFHICKSFLEKLLKNHLLYIVGPAVLLPCCSSILRLSLSATVIFQQKSYWIKKRIFNNMGGEKGKNFTAIV